MANIQIFDDIYADPRFKALLLNLPTDNITKEDMTIGLLVRLWRSAQKYWAYEDESLIPNDIMMISNFPTDLLEKCNFIEKFENGYYVKGSKEKFQWLINSRNNGRKGGKSKNKKYKKEVVSLAQGYAKPIPSIAVTNSSSSSSSSSSSLYSNTYIVEIIDHLNKTCGTKYKYNTKTLNKFINARLGEGFTADKLKQVIDLKARQWLKDPKMRIYLRPSTLFNATKFQEYVNELEIPKQETLGSFLNDIAREALLKRGINAEQ